MAQSGPHNATQHPEANRQARLQSPDRAGCSPYRGGHGAGGCHEGFLRGLESFGDWGVKVSVQFRLYFAQHRGVDTLGQPYPPRNPEVLVCRPSVDDRTPNITKSLQVPGNIQDYFERVRVI